MGLSPKGSEKGYLMGIETAYVMDLNSKEPLLG